jgi:tetratricopeptide (TPR) repeat protein
MWRRTMTRSTSSLAVLAALAALLPGPALAQRAALAQGLRDFTRAMMTVAGNRPQVDAALDTMAGGLDGWDDAAAPPGANALLADEAAAVPVLPLAAYADGFAHLRRGSYRDAIVSLRRAAAVTADERAPLAAAARLARDGHHDEAEQRLRAIVGAWPDSGVARWWLGRVYENLNRIADARREYEAVLPVALTGRATLLGAIGRLAHAEGDFTRAAAAFAERRQLTPRDPVAHKDLALIHLEQGQTEAALEAFTAVVALEPRDAEAHAAIGRIRLDAGRDAEAIAALRRALDLRPSLHEARYALAVALRRSGHDDDAAREMAEYERAQREAAEARRRTMAAEAERQKEHR